MTGLRVFTDPASVAVVGASANPAKWGYWLARGALRGAGRRRVDLVNAGSAVIEGVPSVSSLTDLPEVPELVVLCTPAAQVPAVVEQALGMGVRGFLGITAGLDAALAEPRAERRMADRIRAVTRAEAPVMAHIGLTPQSVKRFGGFKVQRDADALLDDARAVADAGAFAVVLEGVPLELGREITDMLDIPWRFQAHRGG